ncbi:GGDEF domain-containing response regulator [Mycoplana dimorpha]|uniref:diguanylate cyclase n=1 Tax=Mycoplana dimorpha TaxID=28320 RepID=A0A2T5B8V1_MYCDI|nr:diguanylate cyclase [Mycoplana dimorpha]PTM95416.1 response regulator receiver modulated diguanylate cyclase [Mycoplana dimorpha]
MGVDWYPQREAALLRHFGRSVLLVEDSRMFSTIVRFRLETELGVRVTHCAAMQPLRDVLNDSGDEYALAIVDLNLPGASPCEALDAVLSQSIPALVFTGSSGEATRDLMLAKGATDYVVKDNPSAVQQVVTGVDRMLAGGHARVLVPDCGSPDTQAVAALLQRQRFQVQTVADGAAALAVLDAERDVDIVVIDLDGRRDDGLVLLCEIRRRYADMGVRVVGICGQDDDMLASRFLRSGGDDFVRKPIRAEEFTCRLFHLAAMHKRFQALNLIASRDYLTDVYNRRYFYEAGRRLVDRVERFDGKASIAIMDIDHFKRLNDTYGHEVGDMVLKAVARRLKARLGGRHLLARLGGEEFGVLFEGLGLAEAVASCDMLRRELAAAPIEADGEPITITVSTGVAAIEGHEVFDNHLNAADQFLYMAKHAGRDRVFSELSLPAALAG